MVDVLPCEPAKQGRYGGMPASTDLSDQRVELRVGQALGVLHTELVVVAGGGSMTGATGASIHEGRGLAQGRHNRHVIGRRAANRAREFDNVEASMRAHGGIALLQLNEAPAGGQDAAKLLRQWVVAVARTGTCRTLAAMDVVTASPMLTAAAAAAEEAKAASARATKRNAQALAKLNPYGFVRKA